MVIWTFFHVVTIRLICTRLSFEQIQIQKWYTLRNLDVLSAIVAVLSLSLIKKLGLYVWNNPSRVNKSAFMHALCRVILWLNLERLLLSNFTVRKIAHSVLSLKIVGWWRIKPLRDYAFLNSINSRYRFRAFPHELRSESIV